MSSPQFEIVLKGVLAGFDAEKAKADFASLFSLDAEKVERLFAAERTVLKTKLSQEIADKYRARLAAIGVDSAVEAINVEYSPTVESGSYEEVAQENEVAQSPTLALEPIAESVRVAPVSDQFDGSQRHPFIFSGKGVEYFKIWIVNILLSIVTLGIYSAWAKVRNKQYFYGNTQLANNTFEYTANPIKILKGRVIAVILYGALIFANHISPIASVIATIVFLIFLPIIIVNSLRFNARYSSYRNISFNFSGTIWGAVKAFILWPLAGIFTLGLLFPFSWKRQSQYITNNHSYGTEPFVFDVHIKEYYKMLLVLIGATVVFIVAIGIIVGGSIFALASGGATSDPKALISIIPAMFAYLAYYLAVVAYVIVTLTNLHWNNTRLNKHSFSSNWSIPSYAGLLLTNTLGILITLGLFIPFAKVRAANYKANHTTFIAEGNLDSFIAKKLEQSSSLAEGVHDIFDIDISI
ncbi:MAG: DUF898 domain-containing protein [Gammaproteobacteria bacterium]|nr:MAG: DUF898 domain-containing protein [Gammaproteobacteria bacterium]